MSTIQTYNPTVNVLRSLLWAFNDAVNLQGLLQDKQTWYTENHVTFWNNWVRDVFDLRTANIFGVSVWSRILDVPFVGTVEPSPPTYPAFAFDNGVANSPIQNFFDPNTPNTAGGNFATDADASFGLSVDELRLLLRLRFFQLVTRGAIPEINRFLRFLFGPDELYATDNLDMTMRYVFIGAVARNLIQPITQFDLLPRPAGVRIIIEEATVQSFGFEPVGQNFDNGSFRTP